VTATVEARPTRRELVRGATLSRAAMSAVAGAALGAPAASAQGTAPDGDTRLLGRTLRVEQLVVIAYRRVLASRALSPRVTRTVQAMLGQELAHVATLQRALEARGAQTPAPPRDLVAAQRRFAARQMFTSLTDLPTQKSCLKLLIDVETTAESAYLEAIAKLSDAQLLRMSTEIMGCEAQHWTVLSAVRHHGDVMRSVPYPFVGGST
jgi:rubrerythrin